MLTLRTSDPLETLFNDHADFIRRCVSRFDWAVQMHGVSREDLESEGRIGLLKAWRNYDPAKAGQAQFTSYAFRYINGAIHKFMQRHGMRIPVSQEQYRTAGRIMADKLHDLPPEEIAKRVGCTVSMATRTVRLLSSKVTSLNQPIPGQEDGELQDVIVGGHDDSSIEAEQFLSSLRPQEAAVLRCKMQGYSDSEIRRRFLLTEPQLSVLSESLQQQATSYFQLQGGETVKPLNKEDFIKLKESGLSDEKIAKQFKLASSTMGRMKKEWGLTGFKSAPVQLPADPVSEPAVAVLPAPKESAEVAELRRHIDALEQEITALKTLVKLYI
ncbi:hypothetical protein M3223_08655 [Paenibacillus pasadenensis]|uniref:sigma-70 family RNA polymerase sigma factor n=1 Tax=Paenibacillus pasadenensis TaxID=217090 RepID=UPI002040912B|nr:hypothetical protein [Paenibacillus pasadenensis]